MYKVEFGYYDDPDFNIRVVIPAELKDKWMNEEVIYNVDSPYDPMGLDDLFVDSSNLFISVDKARESELFSDEDGNVFDVDYEGVPSTLFLLDDGEFSDDVSFITSKADYFNEPSKVTSGNCLELSKEAGIEDAWKLEYAYCDQMEFDEHYQDYFDGFPEDSDFGDHDFDEDDEDWDEEDEDWDVDEEDWDEEDEDFEESKRRKMIHRHRLMF